MNKVLVRYEQDFGRLGSLDGLFTCNREQYDAMIIASEVYLGEMLGKHSHIYAYLNDETLTIVSDDQEKIAWLEFLLGAGTISGINPLDYMDEED